ncbi:hypothetical protein LSG25_00275 [Paralcaligenes sp. KSB-10]|jgi:hypothetical protein|uniref:hypothetical protein n=1 Tax=Paralcaligenes sp. KSB-10 TaxID=2901142 RepID=UPI001E4D5736|nr:hypothetical protein [Paralcaligenes sp. KSB-10]UHL64392.1 hypothetical protein LSG25_00275 [Paralcaligenes sp. KSB-10]
MKLLLIAVMLSTLSGCVAYERGHYRDHDGYYDRNPHDNRNGGFCPPGQAKKGNC